MSRSIPVLQVSFLACTLLLGSAARAECSTEQSSNNAVVGAVFGAVVGGLLGSRIGSGDGTKVAIGAGVLAGGLLGHRLGGSLSCDEQKQHRDVTQEALETKPSGTATTWSNPDSGHAGSVTPTRTWRNPDDGRYCREFEQTIRADGTSENASGTACRDADGTWKMVAA